MPTKIAVLHGAEPYQAYHVADIALELASRDGIEVTNLIADPAVEPHLDRLEAGTPPIERRRLSVPLWARLGRLLKVLGTLKVPTMKAPANLALYRSFDVIVTPATHAYVLRRLLPPEIAMVYVSHGAETRAASFSARNGVFDLYLPPSDAAIARNIADGFLREGQASAIGYIKLEACERLARATPAPFSGDRPVVLFNPHSKASLSSWSRFARPLIDAARGGAFDLVVAPHVKLFSRRPAAAWRRWERLAVPGRVVIDLGSPAALDMSHALAADIYVGDISSQVYEFLTRPRPCVFLNAHGADWRGNRDYPMWELGEVADTPDEAIDMIARAEKMHPRFLDAQRAAVATHLGDLTPGAARRAADRILALVGR